MSNTILDSETPPAPSAKPAKLNPATILALVLLAAAVAVGLYIGSFWQSHNSRTARLKSRNGDFVQLQRRGGEDEFGSSQPSEQGNGGEASESTKEPAWYEAYTEELFPKPIQVVYWKDPKLGPDDASLLLEFADLEILTIVCESIKSTDIERFLTLPKLRRFHVQANSIDVETIPSWKPASKVNSITLVNPTWKDSEVKDVYAKAKPNGALAKKLNVTNNARPAAGGG